MKVDEYKELRAAVIDAGYGEEVRWAQNVKAPTTPEALWREYSWVVINSGMRNQVAQGIWARVQPHVEAGGSARDVFGHAKKAEAIDWAWRQRRTIFARFGELRSDFASTETMLRWCVAYPWIGPITKYHLAKNLGIDVAKPDRWLERVAACSDEKVAELCARLARESGDRIATVDLVIWRACNLGLWAQA